MTERTSAGHALPSSCDVVVVGGGVLGASVAFNVAGQGLGVVLIDRGDVGSETSSQGAGFLCSVRSTRATTELAAYSTSFYRRIVDETGYPVPLHFTGGLRVALTDAALARHRAEAELGSGVGVRCEFMTPDEMAELVPGLRTAEVAGGMLVRDEGYVTSTKEVALAFVHGANARGADLWTGVEVTGVDLGREGTHTVATSRGSIRTRAVVLAANAGIWPLARAIGAGIAAYPIVHQCAVYSLPSAPAPDMPTVRIPEHDLYIRREGNGLLIGSVGAAPDGPPVDAGDERFRLPAVDPDAAAVVDALAAAQRFFPDLSRSRLVRTQQGLAMVAPDLEPLAGEWLPGVYVVTADLRGIQLAPALGLLIAELVAGQITRFDAAPYRPDRFSQLVARGPDAIRTAARHGLQPAMVVGPAA